MHVSTLHESEHLVLGSGLAGLYYALQVAEHARVTILTKHKRESSNTAWAQGGISAVFDPDDSLDAHVQDTLTVGAGLCDPAMVRLAVERGPALVRDLADRYGVDFDRISSKRDASFALGREGGHSKRRVVHHRDTTGYEIERSLIAAAAAHPNIQIREHLDVVDLLSWAKIDGSRGCFGCYALDTRTGVIEVHVAPVTILATGGCGRVYRYTSNPSVATGDGIAMAYRIGATVANLEFMQFHPTCLFHPDAKTFLISEALRGEGGILRRRDGVDLMADKHELGSLAPRDVVAREIDAELKRSGEPSVMLDMTHLDHDYIVRRFPEIHARCMSLGLDMRKDQLPVVPAAHYMCGGVKVDPHGRTDVEGLFAIGEVAMSGLHGACRLASNSLLEALVLADGAAQATLQGSWRAPPAHDRIAQWDAGAAVPSDEAVIVSANWEEVRGLMWNYVGIVRSDKRLERARRRLAMIREEIREYYWRYRITRDVLELRNIVLVGQLIVESAARRKESRGLHTTLDHPEVNPALEHDTCLRKHEDQLA